MSHINIDLHILERIIGYQKRQDEAIFRLIKAITDLREATISMKALLEFVEEECKGANGK